MKKIALLFTMSLLHAAPTAKPSNTDFDELVFSWSRTFAEAAQLANQKHYKIGDGQQCWINAIRSFLNSLDPHSDLLDPKTYKNMMQATSGEFFGIGIVIDNTRNTKDKHLTIIDTIPDGPADKVGIKPFDKIIEVEGKSLEGMPTEEATDMLKGERHTKVHVKVTRENHPELLSFDITRDVIKEQNSLCFHIQDQEIYYLSLNMFTETSASQLEHLLQQARQKKCKGLILDLRNNTGGLLTSAVDIAGLFLEKGSLVVTTKDKNGTVTEEYRTSRNPIASHIPIFILINNYTASAAEILAGALKIHASSTVKESAKETPKQKEERSLSKNRPIVFLAGTKTFGKGSVQEVIPASNNCAFKITTHLYFLPNDTSVQAEGIIPDFEVERCMPPTEQQQWITKFYGREQTLSNHIRLNEKKEDEKKGEPEDKVKSWTDRAKNVLMNDNQFKEAITLINLITMAHTKCGLDLTNHNATVNFINDIFVSNKKLQLVEVKAIEKKSK